MPSDAWDYTSPTADGADLKIGGKPRHVLMQAPKIGFFYVWDAATGQLLSAEKFAPANWATKIDLKTGRPDVNPAARYGVNKPALVYPAPLGAHNWHPMSYSPRTGLVYIPVTERTTGFEQIAPDKFKINARTYNTGTISGSDGITKLYAQPGAPPRGDVKSYLQAWDPVKGKEVWRVDAKDFGPAGTMVTASDIVFNGNWSGEFAAYDAKTGARLWSAPTQANSGTPSTYTIGGGIGDPGGARGLPKGQIRTNALSANNSRILVFKLGGPAHLPTAATSGPSTIMTRLDPPLFTGTNEQVIDGQGAYARVCAGCHGQNGAADKSIPDLRYSTLLRSISDWNTVVLDGARASKGMASFRGMIDRNDSENIFNYIISQANKDKAAEQAKAGAH